MIAHFNRRFCTSLKQAKSNIHYLSAVQLLDSDLDKALETLDLAIQDLDTQFTPFNRGSVYLLRQKALVEPQGYEYLNRSTVDEISKRGKAVYAKDPEAMYLS